MAITPNGMLSLWQGNLYWGAPQTFANCAAMAGTYGGFAVSLLGVPSALEVIRNSIEAPVVVPTVTIGAGVILQNEYVDLGGIGIGGTWWNSEGGPAYTGTMPASHIWKRVQYECFERDGAAFFGVHYYQFIYGRLGYEDYYKNCLFDVHYSAPGGTQELYNAVPWRQDGPVAQTFNLTWL